MFYEQVGKFLEEKQRMHDMEAAMMQMRLQMQAELRASMAADVHMGVAEGDASLLG